MIILTNLILEYYHTILLSVTTNFPYLYSFILENPSIYDPLLFDHFILSLTSFTHHLTFLLHDLCYVVSYLLLFLLKLALILMPYLHSFGIRVFEFHQKQLKPIEIVIEIFLIVVCILYFLFRKRILNFWKSFLQNLSKKYQTFAAVFPHILFFGTAAILAIFGGKFLIPLSSPQILPIFTLIRPLFHSFRLWRATKPNANAQRDAVVLWTILGSYFALSSFATMIPFSSYLLGYIPAVREFSLVIAIWIQISPVCANLVFESTVPLIHFYTNQIPIADLASSAGISHILHGLQFMGLPDAILTSIRGLLNDGSALIIAVLFFFLPFNLSKIGALIISLLLPAYKSSLVIVQSPPPHLSQQHSLTSAAAASSHSKPHTTTTIQKSYQLLTSFFPFSKSSQKVEEKKQTPIESNPILFWLEYWMCLALLLTLQTYGVVRLWPNSSMLLCLWLQNSHFCGATMIFRWVGKLFQDIVSYEKTRTVPSPPSPPALSAPPADVVVADPAASPTDPLSPSAAVSVYVDDILSPLPNEEEVMTEVENTSVTVTAQQSVQEQQPQDDDDDICLVEQEETPGVGGH